MEKIKCLGRYQKGILIFMIIMVTAFAGIYSMSIGRAGFPYKNSLLIPKKENGSTIYSGKIHGKEVVFIVSADKIVEFQYDGTVYGPYIAREDPTAIPKDDEMAELMTGIELYRGKDVIFRGGIMKPGDSWWIYNEDGSWNNIGLSYPTSDGIIVDEQGNIIDPSVSDLLELMAGPKLTHKGDWLAWFCGVFVCFVTALLIIFADELFRWNLAFQIRDVNRAEPSEWEIASRYISWTGLPLVALAIFIMGLQIQ